MYVAMLSCSLSYITSVPAQQASFRLLFRFKPSPRSYTHVLKRFQIQSPKVSSTCSSLLLLCSPWYTSTSFHAIPRANSTGPDRLRSGSEVDASMSMSSLSHFEREREVRVRPLLGNRRESRFPFEDNLQFVFDSTELGGRSPGSRRVIQHAALLSLQPFIPSPATAAPVMQSRLSLGGRTTYQRATLT